MKKLFIILSIISIGIFYHTLTHRGSVFSFTPLASNSALTVVPLDSRPPCRDFTAQLGQLAGYDIKLPPNEIMDNKETPAQTKALQGWLNNSLTHSQGAIISTDILAFGGLLQNRLGPLEPTQKQELLAYLTTLRQRNAAKPLYVYSVIPRLLVSDHILPDRWYQWHLMQWSVSMDKKLQKLPYDVTQYKELQAEIPLALKVKYTQLYWQNALWNRELIKLAQENDFTHLTIGQDDAMEFGLPNHNRLDVQETFGKLKTPATYKVTQGADEIGTLAVATLFLEQHKHRPKIFLAYSTPKTKQMLLHFVPLTLEQIAKDKINMLQGELVTTPEQADFVLFIHCGDDNGESYADAAAKVKSYMQKAPLALVDLSMNFMAGESLLPALMAAGAPLPQLLSYSGWNTASNAIGSAVAQGAIVSLQSRLLPPEQLPTLYAQNFKFNCARFLDDWAYQREIRYKVKEFEELNGINANATAPHTALVANYIARELGLYKSLLLYTNLNRHPFYTDGKAAYYLDDLDYQVQLPWDRTFEIDLKVTPKFKMRET